VNDHRQRRRRLDGGHAELAHRLRQARHGLLDAVLHLHRGEVDVKTAYVPGLDGFAIKISPGFFDNPRRLGVPGEDLPQVHRRFVSGYPFHDRDVVVIGGKNSASEAALDLYRHGARVTLLVRSAAISDRVKYWIKPDLENRIRAGAIQAIFNARIVEITPDAVRVDSPEGPRTVPSQAVFPLIGYEPDFALFERCGIRVEGPEKVPAHDPDTLESNVPNLYLAGAILGGTEIGRIFIENSRHHAVWIAAAIEKRSKYVPA